MAVSNPIRFTSNAALASPSVGDLYLPVFGGEVLTRYAEYLGITQMVRKQSIISGNTATFPRLGGIGAERHAVGTQLLGLDAVVRYRFPERLLRLLQVCARVQLAFFDEEGSANRALGDLLQAGDGHRAVDRAGA